MNLRVENKFMKNFQKIESKEEVADLLDKVLFKTFFHELEWQEFLEKESKWLKFEHYLYKNEALLTFGKIGNKLISLPFCEYGGPLPLEKVGIVLWEQFERDVFEEFGNNIKIKIHPEISNLSGNPSGASSILSSYWLKNLENTSEQEIWDSFRKTLRHSIKNAQKNSLEIKKCQNLADLKKFYNLYVANLKRKKTVPYPFSVIKYLYESSGSELSLAFYKSKIIAGSLFLDYSYFVHYFLSASDYKHRDLGANHLILWEKIKSLCGQDKIFDLGAAPRGSNLEIFKSGWGGDEKPIYQIGIKKEDERLRSSKLRKIWALLPNFVVKKISRYFIKYRI